MELDSNAPDHLSFRFDIGETHHQAPVAGMWLPAHVRVALVRAGLETLGDIHGMTARAVATRAGLDRRAAAAVVQELRWRCVAALPGWPLVRQAPVQRLWLPHALRTGLARAGLPDVESLFSLGDRRLALAARQEREWARTTLDCLASLAEIPSGLLLAASAHADPWVLPRIDPVILVALARAECVVEQAVALALGGPARDSVLLVTRWLHRGPAPAGLQEIGQKFGLSGERVRQIVATREELLRHAGLRAPPPSDPPAGDGFSRESRRGRLAPYVPAARALLRRLGL